MTHTTPTEHSLMASGGDTVKRGLAIGTRTELFRGVVSAIHQDADTAGIYSLDLTSVTGLGDPTNTYPGMSLDIGTTAGARDIGTVRIRSYGSDANTVTIAETAPADLPVEVGHFVTAVFEFLPHQIPKRIVYTRVAGIITAVTEYLDYDLGYPGGSNPFPPKGNITAGNNADGTVKHVLPFDWEDTPGCGYRTQHLSVLDSVVHNPGATIGAPLWFLHDCTILGGGTVTDLELDVQIPVGFRYIHMFLTDSAGRQDLMFRHMPLWCDVRSAPTMVLRNFNVTSDETELGREMQFEFFGNADEADETVIPEKSLICYFEEPTWTDGDTVPESYRSQVLGWVSDDDPLLKLQESEYGIKVGGTQTWKSRFRANSIGLIDTGSTPTTYTEMQHITVDRAIDFSLIATDTLRSLVNVYYSRVTTEVEALTLPQGDAWTQVSEAIPYAAMSAAGCDSLGNIWLRKQYSFLSDGQRLTVLEAISLTNEDWTDQDGLDLPTAKVNKVGAVTGAAEYWSSGRVLYASQAPGLRSGYGVGLPKLPDQYVDPPTPQADLNRLTGLFYWHENNPIPTVTLVLFGNLDVVEPCWQQPILITWLGDTIRGTTFNETPFVLKHVSIQHTNEPDESTPPKRITYTLEKATNGESGETAPVIQMDGMTQFVDTTCDLTAAFSSSIDVCLVTFTDTSTGDLLYDWLWDFGDGGFSTLQNPTHGYSVPGTYTATLWVSNECGSYDFISHDVTVSAESVAADFTYLPSGLTMNFTDASVVDSDVVVWAWDFGDGSTSPDQNPSRAYASAGTYDVTLDITTSCGNTDTITHSVSVSASVSVPPTTVFMKGATNAAAFTEDGHLYTTANFQAGTPTWTDHDLSGTISQIDDAFVDPFSPLYLGLGGTTVDAWVLSSPTNSTIKIYKVADVFGARTITLKHTSADTSTVGGKMVVSRFQANTLAVSYRKNVPVTLLHQSKVLATQDGTSFTAGRVESTDMPSGNPQWPDHCWIFSDGTIQAIAQQWNGTSADSYYYRSSNNAGSFTQFAAAPPDAENVMPFVYPLRDESLLYESRAGGGAGLYRGGSDISPIEVTGSAKVTLRKQRGLAFYNADENRAYIVGKATAFQEEVYYDASSGGLSWTFSQRNSGGVVTYDGCTFADDDSSTIIAWGVNQIGYTEALGTPLVNKATVSKVYVAVILKP